MSSKLSRQAKVIPPLPAAQFQRAGTTKILSREPDGSVVKRTVLPGGLRVITEQVPGVRSVTVGIWAGVGSRDETPAMAGSAHFLEHLLFKGTKTRSALDISSAIDAVGGEMNAFTSKEYTCYYARVLDVNTKLAVEVLADMVINSVISKPDFEQERHVILEEIAMRDDDHADNAHEIFAQGLFGGSDLGRPILGTVQTINAAQRNAVWKFYRKHYSPDRLVISVAGAVDHAEVVSFVKAAFKPVIGGTNTPVARRAPRSVAGAVSSLKVSNRKTEQAHLVLGMPSFQRGDDRRWALGIMNAVLGGGMSSRLFQEVREQRGLAYSVYSFVQAFADTGYFGVYTGTMPSKLGQSVGVIKDTLIDISKSGLTDAEITRGKGQLRGGFVLGMEDTGARMTRIAKAELVSGELPSVDQALDAIDSVTPDEIKDVSKLILGQKPTIAVVGPFQNQKVFRAAMKGN
jgi:predicted Zn-dependent peptidase